jgi:hypothetical protein
MAYTRGLIVVLSLLSAPIMGQNTIDQMEQFQQSVKQQARSEAIEEQQNRYCTSELKQQLGEVLNAPRDPETGDLQITAYQAWKLEETYKTCSRIKNPSDTTALLLGAIPNDIKQHAMEDMADE